MGSCERTVVESNGQMVMKSSCPQEAQLVCGKDLVTYLNKCTLQFNEVPMAYEGPCGIRKHHHVHDLLATQQPFKCNCLGADFAPVCSLAGSTYENQCVLNCT